MCTDLESMEFNVENTKAFRFFTKKKVKEI